MTVLFTLLACVLIVIPVSQAEEPDGGLTVDTNDPAALQEATRVLREELKLASRPHTYILIDLVSRSVLLKGRGVELHRLPIERWRASSQSDLPALFTLHKRPPIMRRKIDPSAGAEQDPISLSDMPTEYQLRFSPPLTIYVDAPLPGNWQWALWTGRTWYRRLKTWVSILWTGDASPSTPSLQLTLAPEQAQSLAWATTDGMALLIRRTTDK
jgi:hypothetical protein